jgi:dipeptidyl-peptidase-4
LVVEAAGGGDCRPDCESGEAARGVPRSKSSSEAAGDEVRVVDANEVKALDEWELAPRERVQIPARDGYLMEAEILTPHEIDPDKVYPVWLMTYGGPHTPTLNGGWSVNPMAEALASEGYVVLRMDPRSASGKGAASAHVAYRQLGVQEAKDVEDAVNWLKKEKPFVDGSRIGMAGHSYGGYLTAYCMTHTDVFAAGIAGAPVTDWRDYDSFYTERFMLTPQENPEGYDKSSVVKAAADLHGRLLILHGAIDDNVSLRNTMRLVHALQQADKDFEMMIYPSSRHGIFGPHYNRIQVDFIRRTLGGRTPREGAAGGH